MARSNHEPTARQREYLTFIQAFTERWGTPPSFDDIGRHFKTTPPSVNSMIKKLESRGFLTRVPGAPRTLRVLFPLDDQAADRDGDDDIEAAVLLGSLIIERIVPALKPFGRDPLNATLSALAKAIDLAVVRAGGTEQDRDAAFESLRRTALTAQGVPPDPSPPNRRRR